MTLAADPKACTLWERIEETGKTGIWCNKNRKKNAQEFFFISVNCLWVLGTLHKLKLQFVWITSICRSISADSRPSLSPSSVSANASSGSRRSHDSYLAGNYDDEYSHSYSRGASPTFESSFARRVFSETRLNRSAGEKENLLQHQLRSALRNRETPLSKRLLLLHFRIR